MNPRAVKFPETFLPKRTALFKLDNFLHAYTRGIGVNFSYVWIGANFFGVEN